MMNNGEAEKVVVGEISNTQRISLKPNTKGIVVQKEHRKDSTADWIISKGIEIPRNMISTLVRELNTL